MAMGAEATSAATAVLAEFGKFIPLKRQSFPAPDDPADARLVALPTNQLAPPPIPWGGVLSFT
jgi:hypothetical protein